MRLHRASIRISISAAAAGALLLVAPEAAFALPTPETIAAAWQALPSLGALLTGAFGGAGILFWRFVDGNRLGRRFIGGLILSLVLLVCAFACTVLLLLRSLDDGAQRDLYETYLRCDIGTHQLRAKLGDGSTGMLSRFKYISFSDLQAKLKSGELDNPVLLTGRDKIRYDTGFEVIRTSRGDFAFSFAPLGSYRAFLEAVPEAERPKRSIVFNRRIDFIAGILERDPQLLKLVGSFAGLYAVFDIAPAEFMYVRSSGGDIQQAQLTPLDERDWEMRSEITHFFDESRVRFPNLPLLLDRGATQAIIRDPAVVIIAPYNSLVRELAVHTEFLSTYLFYRGYSNPLIPAAERVAETSLLRLEGPNDTFIIDYISPTYEADVRKLAEIVRGKQFVIAAISKHDWFYPGLDITYRLKQAFDAQPELFHYAGATTLLAESAADVMLDDARRRSWEEPLRKLQSGMRDVAIFPSRAAGLSPYTAIPLAAIFLIAILVPVSIPARRSAFARR